MGNQLAGTVPTQILPVEHYLQDLSDLEYDSSLGSTRFFKVARARHKGALVVVKVFVLHDPTLPLVEHKEKLEFLNRELSPKNNCLPFAKPVLTDKAVFLIRQYVKSNSYDRLSTRPFLTLLEKKWIAYQLLRALSYCHSKGICHGDIKLENMLVTSWVWLLLTDFASFKPALLPEDNPADFSYFFDTSRRRTCYVAPERFQMTSAAPDGSVVPMSQSMMVDTFIPPYQLTPTMDIFAAGCSLIELFTEGQAPFDFAQLLAYRSQEMSTSPVLEKMEDSAVRDLLLNMIQLVPDKRLSADEYLQWQRGNVFPECFYGPIYEYMQTLTQPQWGPADSKIDKLHRDLPDLVRDLSSTESGLLIIANVVLSSLRSLQYSSSKLKALVILNQLCPHLTDEIILDRILPYIMHMMSDGNSRVRSGALKLLAASLFPVRRLPRSDANVFSEYILPIINSLAQDASGLVRCTLAQHVADLAEIALKFLELSHWRVEANATTPTSEIPGGALNWCNTNGFESELQALQESFQTLVSSLLTDSDSQVRRTLLEHSVAKLCVFFGRQRASDVIFSHVITFLNDKNDRHLRGSFFDCLAGVASYIGWCSAPICQPLLQQGLSDAEEFVAVKAVESMIGLTQLGLLPKASLLGLLHDSASFLIHPNRWIRYAVVGFVSCAARNLNVVDVQCRLAAILDPYLRYHVVQMDQESLLMEALQPPISRGIWDNVIKSNDIQLLLSTLAERIESRKTGKDWIPHPAEIGGPIKNLLRRLGSEGLNPTTEEQLLRMKEILLKLQRHKSVVDQSKQTWNEQAVIHLGTVKSRSVDLHSTEMLMKAMVYYAQLQCQQPDRTLAFDHRTLGDHSPATFVQMNPEWLHMFGPPPATLPDQQRKEFESAEILQPEAEYRPQRVNSSILPCNAELQRLLSRRTAQEHVSALARRMVASGVEARAFCVKAPNWVPKGVLIAHLHEHKAAVTRLAAIRNTSCFASGSMDGSVKIWDCVKFEGRNVANRSRQTCTRMGSGITSLATLQSGAWLASASSNGMIHVMRIETGSSRSTLIHHRQLDLNHEGSVVDLQALDYGNQSVLVYATLMGSIVGWDLRSPGVAWKLDHNLRHGVITSMCIDPSQSWLAIGTDNGVHICWDLRFRLPVASVNHPGGARVLRLLCHPTQPSCLISAVNHNNEISIWDWENQSRTLALWASPTPPLSSYQGSCHNSYGAFIGCRIGGHNKPFILSGGSDLRLRYWDLFNPEQSALISGGAYDTIRNQDVTYDLRLVDGVEVIQETQKPSSSPLASHGVYCDGLGSSPALAGIHNLSNLKASPPLGITMTDYNPPSGHADVISDITMVQGSQSYIVSASKDGVVKVWK
uniref:non-specific serine/threonine protein kinase n=1 Tax=Daphnia galeata TaxID=27404 RepID=A0A8J2WN77_9CRUS|nr:unnamed protein product [Daphnia galeata]